MVYKILQINQKQDMVKTIVQHKTSSAQSMPALKFTHELLHLRAAKKSLTLFD